MRPERPRPCLWGPAEPCSEGRFGLAVMDAAVARCQAVIQKSSLLSALSCLRSLKALGVCRCPARRCEALVSQSCAQRHGARARHLEHQGSLNTALFLFFFLPILGSGYGILLNP